ncbi:hypothetical protein SVA_0255 [Sulfurifustis variabilis]|uniref:DUF2249 domain-containing protein n=1 Tax=Sulfurifustis variabilis TaxID=1675686 RepID=A0A1B4VCT7_9GAMM|nr:DUF2249 domain-containing protein [Sulfurifustis variabilis]BAU46837.1 hypothetical protein SVA_0255 [Sulfurifustis variabilis]
MTVRERVIDVSALPPPEPLERALAALPALSRGEYLRMLHWREPFPLYAILPDLGFAYAVRAGRRAPYEILIWRRGDAEAEAAASPRA